MAEEGVRTITVDRYLGNVDYDDTARQEKLARAAQEVIDILKQIADKKYNDDRRRQLIELR